MDFLKCLILLWTCIIADGLATPVVCGGINPFESRQNYCGKLLEKTIQIVCGELKINRLPRETFAARAKVIRDKHRFLRNNCCAKVCSLNFIKANCLGTRKGSQKQSNASADTSLKPTELSKGFVHIPKQRLGILSRFGKQNNTKVLSPIALPTSTSRPTTTTTTRRPITRRPTTTTTTTPEYYIDDYFILPPS